MSELLIPTDDQRLAAAHILSRRETMLVMDAGLGKSGAAIQAFQDFKRVLIVCNSAATVSWPQQLKNFDKSGRTVFNIDAGDDFSFEMFGKALEATIIVSFDLLGIRANADLRAAIRQWEPEAVIIDECQYLMTPTTNRTKAIFGVRCDGRAAIVSSAQYVAELSATPMPNHAGELYSHYRALFTDLFLDVNQGKIMDKATWETRYTKHFDGKYGRTFLGSKNMKELRDHLAPAVLRIKKDPNKFPPLRFEEEYIPLDDRALKDVAGILPLPDIEDEELEAWLETAPGSTVRRALGLAKVKGALQWIEHQMNSGVDKLVVFASHTDVVRQLYAGLTKFRPVLFEGATHYHERVANVSTFQGDPKCRIFLGQLVAAGTAITLTAAKHVAIVEPSGSPTRNYQAACRAHRLGIKDAVLCRFLKIAHPSDERISKMAARRARDIAELFD